MLAVAAVIAIILQVRLFWLAEKQAQEGGVEVSGVPTAQVTRSQAFAWGVIACVLVCIDLYGTAYFWLNLVVLLPLNWSGFKRAGGLQ